MSEKKPIKVGLGTTICIFIIILLVIALVVMYCHYNKKESITTNNSSIASAQENTTKVVAEEKDKPEETSTKENSAIQKIDNSKELVYTIKIKVKGYNDSGNIEDKEIEIPQINLNYDNIKELNNKIQQYTKDWSMGGIESNYYINDEIISLVLTYRTEGDPYNIFVYNIDAYTGNILTNEELLYKKNITDNLEEKIRKAEDKVLKENNVQEFDDSIDTWTMISQNCNDYRRGLQKTIPMFLNENGKLSVVIEYCVPAGSGGPWGVIVELQ